MKCPFKTPKFTEAAVFTTTPTVTISSTPTSTSTPAPALGVGSSYVNPVDGATAMYIPAGSFLMGGQGWEEHEVYLDAFWIYQTEVTGGHYQECVEDGVCTAVSYENRGGYGTAVIVDGWNDAQTYCLWAGGRLPTEAEWEKAARGGLEGKLYPWGNEDPTCTVGAENGAWFSECTGGGIRSFQANGYGLYDMAGNVWEWVGDWYSGHYYQESPIENPQGPESGVFHVLRGGSGGYHPRHLQVSNRYYGNLDIQDAGFRCVIPVDGD